MLSIIYLVNGKVKGGNLEKNNNWKLLTGHSFMFASTLD